MKQKISHAQPNSHDMRAIVGDHIIKGHMYKTLMKLLNAAKMADLTFKVALSVPNISIWRRFFY